MGLEGRKRRMSVLILSFTAGTCLQDGHDIWKYYHMYTDQLYCLVTDQRYRAKVFNSAFITERLLNSGHALVATA